ncbi:alpha-amylase [Fontibacillus phaseoli]|uniref:Alpha-amylase n=1 Tax=Fontibacillus phaseoli TaxID=1416533 RepID=A0A369BSU2_9BACL|nr:starch-binding protein [Fontibacillus phaseoli]RCX22674.1 alpha-amylase [Fontibacillus phaseoli]
MKRKARPFWSLVLFVALLLQSMGLTAGAQASTDTQQLSNPSVQISAAADYGLPAKTKDGLIFHAWNWSFDTITKNLPALAEAGFKAVQTSPIQGTKEDSMEGSKWWVLYQPTNFKIGNTQLGNRDQFKKMNDEAEKHGISIIVDVVANHMANAGGGNLQYTPAYNVDSSIRNNGYFWHEARGVENWDNRWQVTQWGISLPDLNTSNQELQNIIIGFLNDAIALGADGFRFDAAKHIELPNETAGSNFWPRVLGALDNKANLFNYGEVLQGGADNFAGYTSYLNLTTSNYGHDVRSAVGFGGSKNVDSAKSFNANNVSPSKLVTWVESHDTYANDKNESTGMSDQQIKLAWSIVASRAETTSLFFNRPTGGGKFAGRLGDAGNTLWQDPDIVAVNKFHNAMVGEGEYLRTQGNQILFVERGTKGMTIINVGGNAQINSETKLMDGVYENSASGGGTFTVSNGRITGNIGAGKVAVLYKAATQTPTISIDKAEGGFYTDSIDVKMTYSNANSASYTLNGGPETPFSSGTTVKIGTGSAIGSTFVLKIVANSAAGQIVKTYTFTKEDPRAGLTVHFYKPSGWGTPNIYYYNDSVTPVKEGAAWPGTAMKDEGNGWYVYHAQGWNQAKVIFNSGANQSPGPQSPGYAVQGEKWIKNGVITSNHPDGTAPTISIDKPEGAFYSDSLEVTLSYKDANAGTYSLNGSSQIAFTSGQKVTFGAGDAYGSTYTLVVTANNADKNTIKTYTFTKTQNTNKDITVHYFNPADWGAPNIYYYDDTLTPKKENAPWPGTAMQNEGNGWYSYTISGWNQAKVIFNSGGKQAPGAEQPGYLVSGDSWIKNGVITDREPEPVKTLVPVTFIIKNATTFDGQGVYLTGNVAELGNWRPENAVGPGQNHNYPDWIITVDLLEGEKIEFKAIKKYGNQVVWEGGQNHSYTVTASNPAVEFYFNN